MNTEKQNEVTVEALDAVSAGRNARPWTYYVDKPVVQNSEMPYHRTATNIAIISAGIKDITR